jgi:hypothetical protein
MTVMNADVAMITRMRAIITKEAKTMTRVMMITRMQVKRKSGTGRKECGKIPLKSMDPDLKTEERTREYLTQYIIESDYSGYRATR